MIITAAILKKISPPANAKVIADLEKYLAPTLEKYGINTPLRVAHFLAQAAHESDHFKTLREYWGPTAAQKRYEGRKDLGNVIKGDGKLFMGRGIFQLTGRANYETFGEKIDVDLVSNPELAASGKYSVIIACEYWNSRGLNKYADQDDIKSITKRINGGYNGLDDRVEKLKLAKKHLAEIFSEATPADPDEPVVTVPAQSDDPIILKRGDKGSTVAVLQVALNMTGAKLATDGDFGPGTEKAVKAYQKSQGLTQTGSVTRTLHQKLIGG